MRVDEMNLLSWTTLKLDRYSWRYLGNAENNGLGLFYWRICWWADFKSTARLRQAVWGRSLPSKLSPFVMCIV